MSAVRSTTGCDGPLSSRFSTTSSRRVRPSNRRRQPSLSGLSHGSGRSPGTRHSHRRSRHAQSVRARGVDFSSSPPMRHNSPSSKQSCQRWASKAARHRNGPWTCSRRPDQIVVNTDVGEATYASASSPYAAQTPYAYGDEGRRCKAAVERARLLSASTFSDHVLMAKSRSRPSGGRKQRYLLPR